MMSMMAVMERSSQVIGQNATGVVGMGHSQALFEGEGPQGLHLRLSSVNQR
jgi:hypothetical protein